MKKFFILNFLSLVFLFGCERIQTEVQDDSEASLFSNQASILKISYIEEELMRADFAEGTPERHNLTYIEEPRSERKKVYIEIYDDLTFSKEINFLESKRDFPADKWKLPADMPEMKKITYSNGFTRGYDASGKLIFEQPFEDTYWIDHSLFDSKEEAIEYVKNSYFDPREIAAKTMGFIRKHSNDFEMLDEQIAVVTNRFTPEATNTGVSIRAGNTADEVVEEKNYILPEYGVVYRTEGYTSDGTLKDVEHSFYTFTDDDVFVMESSHYRNQNHSEAYDLSYIDVSDIFYEDYNIQSTNN